MTSVYLLYEMPIIKGANPYLLNIYDNLDKAINNASRLNNLQPLSMTISNDNIFTALHADFEDYKSILVGRFLFVRHIVY